MGDALLVAFILIILRCLIAGIICSYRWASSRLNARRNSNQPTMGNSMTIDWELMIFIVIGALILFIGWFLGMTSMDRIERVSYYIYKPDWECTQSSFYSEKLPRDEECTQYTKRQPINN